MGQAAPTVDEQLVVEVSHRNVDRGNPNLRSAESAGVNGCDGDYPRSYVVGWKAGFRERELSIAVICTD